METTPLRCDLVLEQTLGHVTHTKNLQRLLPDLAGVEPRFVLVPFDAVGPSARIAGWSNWTIRAGMRAKRLLHAAWRSGRPDVMFVHTQVPGVLLRHEMRAVPTVVSLDATPLQYDELGEFYAHPQGPAPVERLKFELNRRCFGRAAHVVTWSTWAKRGLVDDYGVDESCITVISPGVDTSLWHRADAARSEGPIRILFVGADLRRKGGDLLIDAVRRLRSDATLPDLELHLVTMADVEPEPGVHVHRGLTANSPELIAHYHAADVFCLPTLGDCLPMVLAEAAAAGLPLVSTDVGAIHEIVRADETGALVPPGNTDALVDALRRMVADDGLRARLGSQARRLADREHDARTNARRIVEVLAAAARGGDREAVSPHR
jgi:glycosyltransferase involved in cell wall biosynthesis